MNKQDLIKGEYYVGTYIGNTTSEFIWKCYTDKSFNYEFRIITNWSENLSFVKYGTHSWNDNIRLATPEEKHWLNKCIELNKFITKEEAMESFIPEYVKCIRIWTGMNNFSILNKIYNTTEKPTFSIFDWNYILNSNMEEYFIPSTKKEFEDQNKSKEIIKQESSRKVTIELYSRVYSLDEITKVINDNYEKEDALEIIKTIKSIK